MKKQAILVLGLLVIFAAGMAVGLRCRGRCRPMPAKESPDVPEEKATPEWGEPERASAQAYLLSQQELKSGAAYDTGSLVAAQQALERLLDEGQPTSGQPGAEDPAQAKAMTHARLARLALAQGEPMEYERHLEIALELTGDPDEDSLFRRLDQLDQAQQEALVQP